MSDTESDNEANHYGVPAITHDPPSLLWRVIGLSPTGHWAGLYQGRTRQQARESLIQAMKTWNSPEHDRYLDFRLRAPEPELLSARHKRQYELMFPVRQPTRTVTGMVHPSRRQSQRGRARAA